MSEYDPARIHRLQPIDPARGSWQRRRRIATTLMPIEHIGAVVAARVLALAGDDDRAIGATNDERLVAVGVPGRGHDENTRQHLEVAIDLLIPHSGRIDEVG